jgi:hypothetical protein
MAQLGFRNAIWEATNSAATDEQSGVVHARQELRYSRKHQGKGK